MLHLDKVIQDVPSLLLGIPLTLWITLAAFLLGSAVAVPLALARLSPASPINGLARAWTNFFLMTPPLVHVVWVYYVLPTLTGIRLSDVAAVILALASSTSAQMAEVFRGGIAAVPRGQTEASRVLGLGPVQRYLYVVIPQALRFFMAPSCNAFASLMKDSSLAAVIAVPELMNRGQVLSAENFRPLEVLTFVAIIYFVLIYPFVLVGGALERYSKAAFHTT
jgi:polar amino acid transport system permease protein